MSHTASVERRTARRSSLGWLARAVLRGAVGGLIATVVMTLYRLPIFKGLPPTAEFWARYVAGGEAEDHPVPGFALHLLYGTVAGAAFGAAFALLDGRVGLRRDYLGVVAGPLYGFALSVFGTRVLFPYVLRRDLDHEHAMVFHVGHVVYGLTLGTWLASRERLGEVYE